MLHNTILNLKVLYFTMMVFCWKSNVLKDSPTVQIDNYPENIDDFYVEKIELSSNEGF